MIVDPELTPICQGSKAEFEAVEPDQPRQEVRCGVCERPFNVRVVRTRQRVALIPSIVIVPDHRAQAES